MITRQKIASALRAGILASSENFENESSSDDSSDVERQELVSVPSDVEPTFEDLSNSMPASQPAHTSRPTEVLDVNENAVSLIPSSSNRTREMVQAAIRQAAKRSIVPASSSRETARTRIAATNRKAAAQAFPYAQREWSNTDFDASLTPDLRAELRIIKAMPILPNELDYVGLFFDARLVSYIVEQSNLYANFRQFKRLTKEGPLTESSFWKFLGVLLYMSCVDLKSQRRYWQANTRQRPVADAMSKNRFLEILRNIHFNDAAICPGKASALYDRAYPVRPLINMANERFQAAVAWEGQYSIDEQMVKFTGTTAPEGLRAYMPLKPISHGLKMWARCGFSGYTYQIELCTGGQASNSRSSRSTVDRDATTTSVEVPANTNVGVGGEVVLRFCADLPANSHVYFDNFFTSFALLRELRDRQIWAAGTIRSNRMNRCPIESEDQMKRHGRGHWDFKMHRDGIEVVAWYDNKRVLLASNYVGVEPHDSCQRWDKDEKVHVNVTRPAVVKIYNERMGGVDLADQLVATCPIPLKSKKWYRRVVCRVFDLCIINAWILYRKSKNSTIPLWEFKYTIAMSLLSGAAPRYASEDETSDISLLDFGDQAVATVSGLAAASNSAIAVDVPVIAEAPVPKKARTSILKVPAAVRFLNVDHLPVFSETRARCRNEVLRDGRLVACDKKTIMQCSKCEVALCTVKDRNCFFLYHTQ